MVIDFSGRLPYKSRKSRICHVGSDGDHNFHMQIHPTESDDNGINYDRKSDISYCSVGGTKK